jgi:1-deoxy-D-xylulose-5-phosphate synthase
LPISNTFFVVVVNFLVQLFKWRPIVLPDNYIEHTSADEQLNLAGLSGHQIAATTLSLLGSNREAILLTS